MVERGHKEKEVRKQVLRRRAICRDDLLNRERTVPEIIQIAFSLTSYPSFLKMSGKSLKNYTFYLHQNKLIIMFSQKYLLLVLKTATVLRKT